MTTEAVSSTEQMDLATLDALRGSIRKWEKIVAGTGVNRGTANCPLCLKFHTRSAHLVRCFGCPVHKATGKHGCQGSPYEEYEDAEGEAGDEEMNELAHAELDFLKSLLPKDETNAAA